MSKRKIAAITLVFLLLGLVFFNSRAGQRMYYRVDHLPLILQASKEQKVSPYLVAAVIFTESRFRSEARSEVGAVGLMQLMPETAREVSQRLGDEKLVGRLAEPEVNITLGTAYLKQLQSRFPRQDLALAAYNAGPTLVDDWRAEGGSIPYPETRSFVQSVQKHEHRLEELYPEWDSAR